jgi:hypothetical protein
MNFLCNCKSGFFFFFYSFRANPIQILESFVDHSIDLVYLKPLTIAMALKNLYLLLHVLTSK